MGSPGDALDVFPDLPDAEVFRFDADVPIIPDIPDFGPDRPDFGVFDIGSMDAGEIMDPPATINLIFDGACQPDFGGQLVVEFSTQFTISSLRGPQLQASLQLDLGSVSGAQLISSRNRLQTGQTLTLVAGNSWTNLATDPDVLAGEAPDPIEGTLLVTQYEPATGVTSLTFVDVTLQSATDDSLCTINGTVTTVRLGQ